MYVGLNVAENPKQTALSPLLVPGDGHYIDWLLVKKEDLDNMSSQIELYNKAQELKALIDKIKAQNGNASSLEAIYLNEESTMAELETAIEEGMPIYIQALIDNAPDKENVDVTLMLANPNFEDSEKGWTVKAAAGSGPNGRAGNVRPGGSSDNLCYEAWNNSNFDIYQIVKNAPVGVYEIEVQGFYRYGRGATAWNAYLNQNVDYVKPSGVPVYIYMNNNATNFVNVYGDPKQITNGAFYSGGSTDYTSQTNQGTTYYFPDGMASAAIAFSDGMYTQSAFGLVAKEGDQLQLGVKGNSAQLNDSWCIWDNFKLYYRGFKADVIKPVLLTAIDEVKIYEGMPMGKTEYAALTKGLEDAQTAIENNDGTAMFNTLNTLYDIKEQIIASKDIFVENGVSDDIKRLSDAIKEISDKKLSKTTFNNANNLLTGLKANTIYENSTVGNIKGDVSKQIENLNNSVELYSQLNNAITTLNTNVAKKAYKTTIEEAASLATASAALYEEGSIEDANVPAKLEELSNMNSKVLTSISLYEKLATAITNLENAINEVSGEKKHVSKAMLDIANAQLTSAKKGYTEGTIADDKIDARVTSIENIITKLTASVNLYKDFAAAIEDLKNAIDGVSTKKLAQSTLDKANYVYNNAVKAYNDGSIADEDINGQISELNSMKDDLNNSVSLYSQLSTAIKKLENSISQEEAANALSQTKVSQEVVNNATFMLNNEKAAYNDGSIDDSKVTETIADINEMISKLEAAVEVAQTSVTIGGDGYATFYSAKAISFVGTEVKAYIGQYFASGYVKLIEVTEIPANTPVIVEANKGTYKLNIANSPSAPENNDLIIIQKNVQYGTLYVLANKNKGIGFYKWSGSELPVGRVAIEIATESRDFIDIHNDATRIDMATYQNGIDNSIYNLQGNKVEKARKKGVYIVNGRKTAVK